MTETEPRWITTSEAADLLGVSARAVQRRAERGTIAARQVEHGHRMRWEIDARDLDESAVAKRSLDVRSMDAKGSPDVRMDANIEREDVRQTFAQGSPDVRQSNDAFNAHLIEENKFLRATIEQLQRDGAETRAALREALKLAPKELPVVAASSGSDDAPESGQSDTHKPQRGKDNPKASSSPQTPADTPKSGISYGDIADELDRMMNR